jgi:phosphoglycerate dehydrogenase-like enzyme
VLIVGGGGIGQELARLLSVFQTETTMLRRHPSALPHTVTVRGISGLHAALPEADVVVLATALTSATRGMFSATEFSLMKPTAVLVNVARGGLIVTDDLVHALRTGRLAGAGLDVTEPEPLPSGHALWRLNNAIVTPHTADTEEMTIPLLARRIAQNTALFAAGRPLLGVVDRGLGY